MSFGSDTAVILDLDKTTLGARGRNDHVINAARLEAVRQTVQTLLGSAFDAGEFETSYNLLNQTEFHPFTTDNQDYLAYLCLILGSDLYERQGLVTDIRMGTLARFTDFLDAVEARAVDLPEGLGRLHDDIYKRVKAGDATPFKAFRFNEFLTTVGRMGTPRDGADLATRLAEEILLTQEAREAALAWRETGALLFGLSDKPDEASMPSAAQAAQGYRRSTARRHTPWAPVRLEPDGHRPHRHRRCCSTASWTPTWYPSSRADCSRTRWTRRCAR